MCVPMFIAALFIIFNIWKQPKHPLIDEYYSAIKRDEILPLATTWIDLEGVFLCEISQTEKDKYHISSLYVE